ncbi:MAG: hypothetical protein L6Q57_07855 [Alphaproteobacteria bacterium]|nr:hypothetical protein [Alphaproteobacteria bacterium]
MMKHKPIINTPKEKRRLEQSIRAQEEAVSRRDSAKEGFLARLRRRDRKSLIIAGGTLFGVILAGLLFNSFMAPKKGGMPYGLCRVFLELQVQYPETLRIGMVEVFKDSTRIWFTQIDGFGSYRNEPIQCYFHREDGRGWVMDRALISRRAVDPRRIAAFNRSLPVFSEYPPDLTLPYEVPNQLRDLKFETDMFRQKLF